MKDIILATANPGKIVELQAILSPLTGIPQEELLIPAPKETGLSFIENAILKARHASTLGKKPALADDSGLVIPALNGEPGIYSSRYAGSKAKDQDNLALVLRKLANRPIDRKAFFYCVVALVLHAKDPTPLIGIGTLQGEIIDQQKGAFGFGYDPIFFIPSLQCTLAELAPMTKNKLSHRAMALKQLQSQLGQLL